MMCSRIPSILPYHIATFITHRWSTSTSFNQVNHFVSNSLPDRRCYSKNVVDKVALLPKIATKQGTTIDIDSEDFEKFIVEIRNSKSNRSENFAGMNTNDIDQFVTQSDELSKSTASVGDILASTSAISPVDSSSKIRRSIDDQRLTEFARNISKQMMQSATSTESRVQSEMVKPVGVQGSELERYAIQIQKDVKRKAESVGGSGAKKTTPAQSKPAESVGGSGAKKTTPAQSKPAQSTPMQSTSKSSTRSTLNNDDFFQKISRAVTVKSLQKLLVENKKKLDMNLCAISLGRLSALSFQSNCVPECAEWLRRNLMERLIQICETEAVNLQSVMMSARDLINLDACDTKLYIHLIDLLVTRFSGSEANSVPIPLIVQFYALIIKQSLAVPDQLKQSLESAIFKRLKEVSEPSLIITLLTTAQLSADKLESLLGHSKELLPNMSSGELVSVFVNLAQRGLWSADILPLIAAALQINPCPLTMNHISSLSYALASVNFSDVRLLRRMATDLVSNIHTASNWNAISSILLSFYKMRFIHEGAWTAIADWINTNYALASDVELSHAMTTAISCGIGDRVSKAVLRSAQIAKIESAKSPVVWLNRVHAFAMGNALTSRLAETVIHKDFVSHLLKEVLPLRRFSLISKLAQIQCCALNELHAFRGKPLNFVDRMKNFTKNDCLELKYGRKKLYEAQCFHELLYKLAPLNTHALPPEVNEDGIFIDAMVMMDRNERFLPVEKFAESSDPKIAIIYLTDKHLAASLNGNPTPVQMYLFCLRLLSAKRIVPVVFDERQMRSRAMLSDKLEYMRKRILDSTKIN